MEELLKVLCCNLRRVQIHIQGDGLYVVSVYAENGRLPIVVREGITIEKALFEATEMMATHGEKWLTK